MTGEQLYKLYREERIRQGWQEFSLEEHKQTATACLEQNCKSNSGPRDPAAGSEDTSS